MVILGYGVVVKVCDVLEALSGHIIVIADPCMVSVEMKIHRFDIITRGAKLGGMLNTDSKHYASISLLFLAYRTTVHVGRFVSTWNDMFTLQN